MDIHEKAKIVAFARLLGVTGSDSEIFDNFSEYYTDSIQTFEAEQITKQNVQNKVEIINRPF